MAHAAKGTVNMVWEDRRLRDITEADVRRLVDSGLEEHLQLEFKSALYPGNSMVTKNPCLIFASLRMLMAAFC